MYMRLDGGGGRGWRVELLVEQLTSSVEQKLLLCSYCRGLMGDACLLEKQGQQELRCSVCVARGMALNINITNKSRSDQQETG